MSVFGIILIITLVVGTFFIIRLFGAWMLRIDDVIDELREIKGILNSSATSKSVEKGKTAEVVYLVNSNEQMAFKYFQAAGTILSKRKGGKSFPVNSDWPPFIDALRNPQYINADEYESY